MRPIIDVAIITITPREYNSVNRYLNELGGSFHCHSYFDLGSDESDEYFRKNMGINELRGYEYRLKKFCIKGQKNECIVALTRCLNPGSAEAGELTQIVLNDLKPKWIFLVGIAGAIPSNDFSLGDVLLSTRVYDLRVTAIDSEGNETYMPESINFPDRTNNLLRMIFSFDNDSEIFNSMTDWTEICKTRWPSYDKKSCEDRISQTDDEWDKKILKSIQKRSERGRPIYYPGHTASGDQLVKNIKKMKSWAQIARTITHVEMELAGVIRIKSKNTSLLSIRGISDIVGFDREESDEIYAGEIVGTFTSCLLMTGYFCRDDSRWRRIYRRLYNLDCNLHSSLHNLIAYIHKKLASKKYKKYDIIKNGP